MLNIPGLYDEKEDILLVIKDLSSPCYDCRLGHCQKKGSNRGLIWRGNPKARIALVSIMPGRTEMETGKPLTGESGKLSDEWFKSIHLDTNKDMLVINVVQCRPPDVEKVGDFGKKEMSQRDPEQDELATCFPTRCLRVLRAMPNLEVVVTMGWTAARCILGGDPKDQSHLGHWFATSLLPGKAVFCLAHPAAILREEKKVDPDEDKGGVTTAYLSKVYRVEHCLEVFKREYLDLGVVVPYAQYLETIIASAQGL